MRGTYRLCLVRSGLWSRQPAGGKRREYFLQHAGREHRWGYALERTGFFGIVLADGTREQNVLPPLVRERFTGQDVPGRDGLCRPLQDYTGRMYCDC